MTVAGFIAEYLKNKGIQHVFGYNGSMMLKIADEISLTEGIEFVQGFHEQASSFMADAYGRILRKIGVVLVTSGPGAINAIAGCADAYMDSIPLLIISGQDKYTNILRNPGVRSNGFQDLDIVNIVKPITKYSVQVKDSKSIKMELDKCFYYANEGRKGPVLLDVPMDIQFTEISEEIDSFVIDENSPCIDSNLIDKVCNEIYLSQRPLIISGGGINTAYANEELYDFVKKTGIPIVTTYNGRDTCMLSIGMSGLYGTPEANLALKNADLLLALGTRFGEQQAGKFIEKYTHARIIHVDIDYKELGRVLPEYISINTDVKMFLNVLNRYIDCSKIPNLKIWKENIQEYKAKYCDFLHKSHTGLDPLRVVKMVGENASCDAVFINDVGNNCMWVAQGLFPKVNQRLLSSGSYGSMGFSIPAAIGSKVACPDRMVISFSGDGGFHMNLQELQFVMLHDLNIKFIVFNNDSLGMMRVIQKKYYRSNYIGNNEKEYSCLNLMKISETYNMDYVVVEKESDFIRIIDALNSPRPTIVNCIISKDSYARNWYEFMEEHPEEFSFE